MLTSADIKPMTTLKMDSSTTEFDSKGKDDDLPVCADVEGDGEGLVGRDAGQGGVEGQLTHRDTHPLRPKVTQTYKIFLFAYSI